MTEVWRWLEQQGVPGFVLGGWLTALPIGTWIHRVTERRHKERLALAARLGMIQGRR